MQIFEFKSSIDMLARLDRQYEAFSNDDLDCDRALDMCFTAWSIADWVYHERHPLLLPDSSAENTRMGNFRKSQFFENCPELRIMHDITNGVKHFRFDRKKSEASSIETSTGAYSNAFSDGYDVEMLIVKFGNDEQWKPFHPMITQVHVFWNNYLTESRPK